MVRDNGQADAIRELRLLNGERIEDRFVPDTGSVPEIPRRGPLLVLTSHRLISFNEDNGDKHSSIAALAELEGVSIKANTRGLRDLFQGLFLLVVGILTYIVLGYILDGVTVALALGAAIAFVGMLFMGKYLFWEEEGSVTFLAGAWETSFPYKNDRASSDLYRLIDRCFQLKLNTGEAPMSHEHVAERTEPAPEDPSPSTSQFAPTRGALVVDADLTAVHSASARELTPATDAPAPAALGMVEDEPQHLSGESAERLEPAQDADQRAYRPWWAQSGSANDPSSPPPSGAA